VNAYGEQQHGPPPGYGAPPWNLPPAPTTWPYGPGRPRSATTAAVLGFVTGGLTAVASLIFLIVFVSGVVRDPVTVTLILGLPCAVGLITGAARLLGGDLPGLLFSWAIAAVGVLVVAMIVALVAFGPADLLAVAIFVVLAVPLPILTAVFAWQPDTRDWASEAR
jgi:hypothetical protein